MANTKIYRHPYDFDNSLGIKGQQDAKISTGAWPQPDVDSRGLLGWWIGVSELETGRAVSSTYSNQSYNSPEFFTGKIVGGQEPVPDKTGSGYTYNYNEAYGKGVYLAGPYVEPTTTQEPTTTEEPIVEYLMFEYDVNNGNLLGETWMEMDFEVLTGSIRIDVGDGQTNLITELVGNYDVVNYEYGTGGLEQNQFQYPSVADYGVKVYYRPDNSQTLQTALNDPWLLYLFDLRVINNLDVSMFPNLAYLSIDHASLSSLSIPMSFREWWGASIGLNSISTLQTINLSTTQLPSDASSFIVGNCDDVTQITAPIMTDIDKLEIHDCPNLTEVVLGNNIKPKTTFMFHDSALFTTLSIGSIVSSSTPKYFGVYSCPLFSYASVSTLLGLFPNLTNRSGTSLQKSRFRFDDNGYDSATVNKILCDIDAMSVSGYNYRRVEVGTSSDSNSYPDTTSGGCDGIAARDSLISKGFEVWHTPIP